MIKYKVLIFCFSIFTSNIFAQTNESEVLFKGIDIHFDFGRANSSYERELLLMKSLSNNSNFIKEIDGKPLEFDHYSNFTNISVLGVLNLKPFILKKSFTKQEFRFGISYSLNYHYTFSKIENHIRDIKAYNKFNYELKSNSEQINFSHLFLSKPIFKNFRTYFGLNGTFGLRRYKSIELRDFFHLTSDINLINDSFIYHISNHQKIDINNSSIPISSLIIPLGLRYNVDCFLNIFTEFKFGYNIYPTFSGSERFQSLMYWGFGIRYKFSKEVTEKANGSFW